MGGSHVSQPQAEGEHLAAGSDDAMGLSRCVFKCESLQDHWDVSNLRVFHAVHHCSSHVSGTYLWIRKPLRLEAVYFGHLTGLAQDQQFVRLWAQQRAVGEDILSVDLHQAVKGFKLKLLMSQARVGVEECARERPGLAS